MSRAAIWPPFFCDLFTAETAEGAEMNGVNEFTNEIIGAAIEVHRTLTKMGIQRLVHELPE